MQYASHATGQDCVSETRLLAKATSNTYPTNDLTRRFNAALDRYLHLASIAGKRWPFDDSGQSAAPIVTQTLTSGTNSYKLSAFAGTFLSLRDIEVLDSSGATHALTGEEFSEIETSFGTQYSTSRTGVPSKYTLFGDFIYLTPTPNYTKAAGLVAYVTRQLLYMAASDTTREPGIPRVHHMYLCRYTALPHVVANLGNEAPALMTQIAKDEKDILEFFGYRNSDIRATLTPLKQNNR